MRSWIIIAATAAIASTARAEPAACLFHPLSCEASTAPAARAEPPPPPPVAAEAPAPASQTPAPQPVKPPKPKSVAKAEPPRPPATQPTAVDPRLVAPYACNPFQRMTLGSGACAARRVEAAHRDVGLLVHQGRCDEAVKTARSTGDEAFAERVHAFCRPTTP